MDFKYLYKMFTEVLFFLGGIVIYLNREPLARKATDLQRGNFLESKLKISTEPSLTYATNMVGAIGIIFSITGLFKLAWRLF